MVRKDIEFGKVGRSEVELIESIRERVPTQKI